MKMLPAIVIGSFTGLIVANSSAGRLTASGRHAAQSFRAAYAHVVAPAHLVATLGLRALPDPVFQAQLMAAARLGAPRRRSSAPRRVHGDGCHRRRRGDGLVRRVRPRRLQLRRVDRWRLRIELRRRGRVLLRIRVRW